MSVCRVGMLTFGWTMTDLVIKAHPQLENRTETRHFVLGMTFMFEVSRQNDQFRVIIIIETFQTVAPRCVPQSGSR